MSDAREFVHSHPRLLEAMRSSGAFASIREQKALEIDDERLYVVKGDTLADEEDLYVETLVRGAQATDPLDPERTVYMELDDEMREVVDQRVRG